MPEFAKDLGTVPSAIEPQLLAATAVTLLDTFELTIPVSQQQDFIAKATALLSAGTEAFSKTR